jgi:hypothetical protein
VITLTCCSGNRVDAPSALPVDLMVVDPPDVPTIGFRPVERAAGVDFRWVLGPRASLVLNIESPKRLLLSLTASNPIEGQSVTVLVNGRAVEKLENIPKAARLTGFRRYEILLDAPSGTVEIALEFTRYNRRSAEDTFAPEDKEPLALTISGLEISPANP